VRRLRSYLAEASLHAERLKEVLSRLSYLLPMAEEKLLELSPPEKDMLDVLAFRFSKLQDLLGSKIFREFLESQGFITEGKSFLEILREVEREGIIDVDTWSEFRKVRNLIAHEYPLTVSERVEAINYLVEKVPVLLEVLKRIEAKAGGK
jgi:hypothetical protein